jgi:hypothetical protein
MPRPLLKPPPFSPQSALVSAMSSELDSPAHASDWRDPEIIVTMDAATPFSDDGRRRSLQYFTSGSPASPAFSTGMYTEWDFEHKAYVDIQHLFKRLYSQDEDVWRVVIKFL